MSGRHAWAATAGREALMPGGESMWFDRQMRLRPRLLSDDPIDVQWRLRRREQIERNAERLALWQGKRAALDLYGRWP